ncbi:M48 family metalloprotease [Sphingomonas sp. MMS24-JH45]
MQPAAPLPHYDRIGRTWNAEAAARRHCPRRRRARHGAIHLRLGQGAGGQGEPTIAAGIRRRLSGPQAAYVAQVGKRVAVQSGLSIRERVRRRRAPRSPSSIAIPGGVLATRQLLALMNSEAELASVLGHEVGHVAARHSSGRQRTATIGGVLASVVGAVAGNSAIGSLLGAGRAAGRRALHAEIRPRSGICRRQRLGVRYVAKAGYSPYAAAEMLTQLSAATTLQSRVAGRDANAVPTWASTHPNSLDRVRRAERLAQATGDPTPRPGRTPPSCAGSTASPMTTIRGRASSTAETFRHPDLRLRFTAPTGYTIANGADAVTVAGQGVQAGYSTPRRRATFRASSPTASRALGATATGGRGPYRQHQRHRLCLVHRRRLREQPRGRCHDRRLPLSVRDLQFGTIVTPRGSGLGPLQPLVASVAPLTAAEASAIRGKRIRIVTVKAGDTISTPSRGGYGLSQLPARPVPDAQRTGRAGCPAPRDAGQGGRRGVTRRGHAPPRALRRRPLLQRGSDAAASPRARLGGGAGGGGPGP